MNLKHYFTRAAQVSTILGFIIQFSIVTRDSGDLSVYISLLIIISVPAIIGLLIFRYCRLNNKSKKMVGNKARIQVNRLGKIINLISAVGTILIAWFILLSVPNTRNFYPRGFGAVGQIELVIKGLEINPMVILFGIFGALAELWVITTARANARDLKPSGWLVGIEIGASTIGVSCFLSKDLGFHVIFWNILLLDLIAAFMNVVLKRKDVKLAEHDLYSKKFNNLKNPPLLKNHVRAAPKWAYITLVFNSFIFSVISVMSPVMGSYYAKNSWYWPQLSALFISSGMIAILFFCLMRTRRSDAFFSCSVGFILFLIGFTGTFTVFLMDLYYPNETFRLTLLGIFCHVVPAMTGFLGIITIIHGLIPQTIQGKDSTFKLAYFSSRYIFIFIYFTFFGVYLGGYLGFIPIHVPSLINGDSLNDLGMFQYIIYLLLVSLILTALSSCHVMIRFFRGYSVYKEKDKGIKGEISRAYNRVSSILESSEIIRLDNKTRRTLSILMLSVLAGSLIAGAVYQQEFYYSPTIRADGNMTGAFQLDPFAFGVCHGDHSEKMKFLNARASRSGGWGWAANAKDPDN
ncbi:MAG: hypothetical protein ACTSXP_04625, partial [Promethearchaeota archaeon]